MLSSQGFLGAQLEGLPSAHCFLGLGLLTIVSLGGKFVSVPRDCTNILKHKLSSRGWSFLFPLQKRALFSYPDILSHVTRIFYAIPKKGLHLQFSKSRQKCIASYKHYFEGI